MKKAQARTGFGVDASGKRRPDSGFALLFVFLSAAIIAITLYLEMPRVAFEAQRTREELLIERGEQYRRAIQLYVRRFKNYPPNLEALDNTNNFRFLRKHYKDPMTGKEDWRLIHIGPGGVLTDSLVTKPPGKEEEAKKSTNTFIGELPAIGSAPEQSAASPGGVPARRPSEGGTLYPGMTAAGGFVQPGVSQPGQPGEQPQTGVVPMYPVPGQQVQAGTPQSQYPQQPGAQPGTAPGQPFAGQQPGYYPQPVAGQTQQVQPVIPVPGLPAPYTQPIGQTAVASPGQQQTGPVWAGQVPFPQPGRSPAPSTTPAGAAQNPAAALIQKLLTTPNPRGLAAIQQQSTGPQIGAGIAGVASKLEAEGIKVYNDKTKYNEWEFVYDYRQDRMNTGAATQSGQQPGGSSLTQPATPQSGAPDVQPPATGVPVQPPSPGFPGTRRIQ